MLQTLAACCLVAGAALQGAEVPTVDPVAPLRRLVGTWDFTAEWLKDGQAQAKGAGTHTFQTVCAGTAVRGSGTANEFGADTDLETVLGWDPTARRYYWFMVSNLHRAPQTRPATLGDDQKALTVETYQAPAGDGTTLSVETVLTLPVDNAFAITITFRGPDGVVKSQMVYHYHRHG